jgi:hypothetical protein
VFHPPLPGGRIQANKLVSPGKDPPSGGWGRACIGLLRKVCTRALDRPLGAAYSAKIAGDSTGAPDGTMHFGELLAIFFCRPGPHHRARADLAWLHRMPRHRGKP